VLQEKQPAPGEGGQHQENTEVVGEVSQTMVILQPAQYGFFFNPKKPTPKYEKNLLMD